MSGVSLDMTLLRLMKYRKEYERLREGLPITALEEATGILITDYGAYFKEFGDVDRIDWKQFMLWFKEFKHSNFDDIRMEMFHTLMGHADDDVPEAVREGIMQRIIESETVLHLVGLAERYNSGEEMDIAEELRTTQEKLDHNLQRKVQTPFCEDKIEDILADEENDFGLKWRLTCLRQSMRGLRPGDFGIIAARPDKGKTSFLTSELGFMVPQLVQMYDGVCRPIIWFNNEGPSKRIKQRYWQSLLGCTIPDMVSYMKDGSLHKRVLEATGGVPPDKWLKIVDAHEFSNADVRRIVEQEEPGLVVADMIDNIEFGGDMHNGGQRTDQVLEEMYKWFRNLGVKYECPVLATSQIDSAGDGVNYPSLKDLKDSKTGKQGAADFIITIGALNDPSMEQFRYIGMTKNKLHRFGGPRDPRTEVIFEADLARFSDPEAA